MQLNRREFMKIVAASGVAAMQLVKLQEALAGPGDSPVIWLQGQGCTGCSVSFLNSAYYATVDDLLLNTISLEYHNNVMASAGDIAMTAAKAAHPSNDELAGMADEWLASGTDLKFDLDANGRVNMLDYALLARRGYTLVVEGAIPTGASGLFCTVGEMTMLDALGHFANYAARIIAVGTCACFGGISAGAPNPTTAKSVKDALTQLGISKPLINIPGCPVHPDWLVGTISYILINNAIPTLDSNLRPTDYFGSTVHSNCPNLSHFNSAIAPEHNDTVNNGCMRSGCHSNTSSNVPQPRQLGGTTTGCLYALSCKGRATYADCPSRKWNSPGIAQPGVNWCIGAKSPCHGCTQPNFPDGFNPLWTLNNVP